MTPVPFRVLWYSIGLVIYRARSYFFAAIQALRVRVRLLITAKIVLIL